MKIALVGPGKMGRALCMNMTHEEDMLIIGRGEKNAKALSEDVGFPYSLDIKDIADRDLVFFVVDAKDLNPLMLSAAPFAKDGAVFVNVATKANLDEEMMEKYPNITFVDGKMISSAIGVQRGLPGFMVVGTKDENIHAMVKKALPGLKDVVMGDSTIVAKINSIGSGEGIRACVIMEEKLKEFNIPDEWAKQVCGCVAPGTMMAYLDNILGEFAAKLAEKIREELANKE